MCLTRGRFHPGVREADWAAVPRPISPSLSCSAPHGAMCKGDSIFNLPANLHESGPGGRCGQA
eukprot:scaffold53253_cov65-Phaeocystis_antarctica.AAC.2